MASCGAGRSADAEEWRSQLQAAPWTRTARPRSMPGASDHRSSRSRLPDRRPQATPDQVLGRDRHLSDQLVVPSNITLIPLPPKCPELNPVENVWQFMRENWLSNRVFQSYRNILNHCCHAWNKLVEQPWTIMSIGLRDWAHGF